MVEVPCPKCKHSNPTDAEVCQKCGAALTPPGEANIRPGVEPGNNVTSDLERALPPWLQSVRKGDGQKPAEETPATEPPAEPKETPGDAPDWLAGLTSEKEKNDDEEVPDWLAGIRSKIKVSDEPPAEENSLPFEADATPAPPGTPEELSAPVDKAPDWLSENIKDDPASIPNPEGEAEPPDEFGQWLAELDAAKSGAETSVPVVHDELEGLSGLLDAALVPDDTEAAANDESPEWLSSVPAGTPSLGEKDRVEEPGLDWFNQPRNKAEVAGENTGVLPAEPESASGLDDGLPDWLSKMQLENTLLPAMSAFKTEPEPDVQATPAEELPDWLAGIETGGTLPEITPALVQDQDSDAGSVPPEAAAAIAMNEQPDWLSDIKPDEENKIAPSSENHAVDAPGSLEKADLPSWVQSMRPVEAVMENAAEVFDTNTAADEGGPLAGLRGVLPVITSLGALQKPPAYSIKLHVDDAQQQHAAHLERIITNEAEPQALMSKDHIFPARTLRWVITLVFIIVIGVTLATGVNLTPAGTLYPPEMIAAMNIIGGLESNSPLLLVFDYQPAFSGEMEAAAAPLIDHALYNGARLTLLSTSPTGPSLAELFLENTQAGHNYQPGEQYVNLGYLSGGPSGILGFSQNPAYSAPLTVYGHNAWQSPPLQGIQKISDYAVIIILTDDSDTGRTWVEQTESLLGDTPMLMVISAQAEPMLRPYYESGQIKGLVTGLAGGKAYEDAIQVPGKASQYWNAFSAGMLVAILMIITGASWNAITTWRNRRTGMDGEA